MSITFASLGISELIAYAEQYDIEIELNKDTNTSSYVEFRPRKVFISATDSLLVEGKYSIEEIYRATFSHELGHLQAHYETIHGEEVYDYYCELTAWKLGESIYKQVYGEPPASYYEIRKQCLTSHGYWREA